MATSLVKFADVFAWGEQNKCQRTINTGDNKPIRQNPVRLPLSQRAVTEALSSQYGRSYSPWT